MVEQEDVRFDTFDFYSDFGRYEGSREAPAPRHLFFVGKSRERAHFLDLLYMKSGLGSYLVTGVRGVGKSSFVRYCLDTYVRDVYERYCRSPVGRSYPDKACMLVALSLPGWVTLVVAPFLSKLLESPATLWPFRGMLLVALTLALLAMGLSPFLCAKRMRDVEPTCDPSSADEARGKQHDKWWSRYLVAPYLFVLLNIGLGYVSKVPVDWWPTGAPLFWVLLPLEAVILVPLALVARSGKRTDGLANDEERLPEMVERARTLAIGRALVMGSLSATLIGTTLWALLFHATAGKVHWACELLAGAFWAFAIPALMVLEKYRLLQPARRMVFETAIHPVVPQGEAEPAAKPREQAVGRVRRTDSDRVARAVDSTLFCAVFGRWLPILRISINLGLDRLSHALVVESMLRGLHEQLMATFERQFGALKLLRRGVGVVAWLYLTRLHLPDLLQPLGLDGWLGNDPIVTLFEVPLLASRRSLAEHLLPGHIDLVWGALFGLVLTVVGRRRAWSPHHKACREISLLLDSLSSHVTLENASSQSKVAQLGVELASRTRKRTVASDPRDPHSLEQALLAVLKLVRKASFTPLPGLTMTLPSPETIFVFDELDKVGTTTTLLDPNPEAAAGYAKDERERSRKLQALLSDLKNLLGTAQARFIFVGGRNLHDEWLADEANRQPLLSNIFDAEIYVRSLLTDYEPDSQSLVEKRDAKLELPRPQRMEVFTHSVRRYFDCHHLRAYETWQQWVNSAGAGHRDHSLRLWDPAFEAGQRRGDHPPLVTFPELRMLGSGKIPSVQEEFWNAFIRFLTFRSRGIPRRARLILETFVRPYDRVAMKPKPERPAQHVLFFEDRERVRIELVSELFQSIDGSPNALDGRDDKVLMAVFLFADFLTRFHRRAFSLQSLERFEESMHIHRAPDTSMVAARLIADWLGTLLETTAAGIHTYRFRLEWAEEIRHVSHLSQHESASANFSLDEAQALKAQLRSQLIEVKDEGGAFEVHTALAELHDLDGDHLDARHHFRRAIDMLDRRLSQEFTGGGSEDLGAVARVLAPSSSPGKPPMTPPSMERQLDWALARLRVMLQLGLTYERTFDYERAGLEYGNALQVARAVWCSDGQLRPTLKSSATALLEPIFAQAWSALKDPVVTESPFVAARDWLTELLLGSRSLALNADERWKLVTDPASEKSYSRELNMLGDLAFFCEARWPDDSLKQAQEAYAAAAEIAERRSHEHEQRARSAFSLALCHLLEHRKKKDVDFGVLGKFSKQLADAQRAAVEAPSSQGPFADSMVMHHIGLELVEELLQLVCTFCAYDALPQKCNELRAMAQALLDEPKGHFDLSDLRKRVLADARWRLRDVQPSWKEKPEARAFPARNRFLNLRSELMMGLAEKEQKALAAKAVLDDWRQRLADAKLEYAADQRTAREARQKVKEAEQQLGKVQQLVAEPPKTGATPEAQQHAAEALIDRMKQAQQSLVEAKTRQNEAEKQVAAAQEGVRQAEAKLVEARQQEADKERAATKREPLPFSRLLRMWRRLDSRTTLAPCRIAIAAPPSEARPLWEESLDVAKGGKRFFALVRDRYYLDDGFGPMLFRANFALTIGFQGVHRQLFDKAGEEASKNR